MTPDQIDAERAKAREEQREADARCLEGLHRTAAGNCNDALRDSDAMSTRWLLTLELPLRIDSRGAGNSREHHMAKHRRIKTQQAAMALVLKTKGRAWLDAAHMALSSARPPTVVVLFERVAPRALDSHDNLRMGLKACADAVADWLGLDDADERLRWEYRQTRGGERQYAVRVSLDLVPAGEVSP